MSTTAPDIASDDDFDPLDNECHDCGALPGEPCALDCDARCADCGETAGRCSCPTGAA